MHAQATILSRIKKVEHHLNLQIDRANAWSNQQQANDHEKESHPPQSDIVQQLYRDMQQQQQMDIEEYIKSTLKVTEFLQIAEVEMDRAKRRLKSITPAWINALGLCLLDLNRYGHQPLTFWRVRVQLHLEATKEDLVASYGVAATSDFVCAIGNVHEDLNMLSSNECRLRYVFFNRI